MCLFQVVSYNITEAHTEQCSHCLIQQYQETVALCSKVSVVMSTVHKCGISTYTTILSNFSLSSQERGIQMYLKILTTYSEKNLGRTELSAVFNAMCESPISKSKM